MQRYFMAICLLLGGCSSLPVEIQNPPQLDLSYAQAIDKIANYKNAPVRWGGTIVEVENEQDFSLVQVLYYPLKSDGRPRTDQPNEGRFLIKTPEFLDPAVYVKNTEITVAGILIGEQQRTIGKKVLRMPLVSVTTLYRWPVYTECDYYNDFDYGYNPYFGGYPYYRGRYDWPFVPPFRHGSPCYR